MNKELENQLASVIEKSLSLAEKTGEFAIEQAPDLLHQFFLWHTLRYCIGIFLAFLIALIFYRLSYLFGKKESFKVIMYKGCSFSEEVDSVKYLGRYFKPDSDNIAGLIVFRILSLVSFLSIIIPNIYGFLKITFAPKIYLIEYFIN